MQNKIAGLNLSRFQKHFKGCGYNISCYKGRVANIIYNYRLA